MITFPLERRARSPWAYVILAALAIVVHAPVLRHGFVHWDDDRYVFENPRVLSGLSADGLVWDLTARYEGTWQPVTWFSYQIDAALFDADPRGYHATNLLLHIGATLLVFIALRRLLRPTKAPGAQGDLAALLVAALFAVHPLHVEPVAWIAGRKDLLAAVFWFAALLFYARFVERPTTRNRLAVFLAFAAGLMSKPVVMTLPLVMQALDAWPLRRSVPWRQRIREKLPLFGLAAASFVVTLLAQREAGTISTLEKSPAGERLANAIVSTALYLRDLVWPFRLAAFYPRGPIPVVATIAAGTLLAAVTYVVLRRRDRWPHLLTGWLWFVIVLLPMSGLVQFGSHARADRFTYIANVGLYLAIAWSLRTAWRGRWLPSATVVLVLLFAVTAHRQARSWRDDQTLFGHALRVTRGNYLAHMKLGTALAYAGNPEAALAQFGEVIRLRPAYLDGWYNYATALNAQGKRAEAIEAFGKGLALSPGDERLQRGLARAWNNRGVDAARAGRVDEALRCFEEAVRVEPEDAEARGNLERARSVLAGSTASERDPTRNDRR